MSLKPQPSSSDRSICRLVRNREDHRQSCDGLVLVASLDARGAAQPTHRRGDPHPSVRTALLVAEPPFWWSNQPPPLFPSPRRIVLLAGARRPPASFSHGRGCRLSSTLWCPLLCGRGLGLGPKGRDPLVSGSTSPSVDSAFTLPRERADPQYHIVRPE